MLLFGRLCVVSALRFISKRTDVLTVQLVRKFSHISSKFNGLILFNCNLTCTESGGLVLPPSIHQKMLCARLLFSFIVAPPRAFVATNSQIVPIWSHTTAMLMLMQSTQPLLIYSSDYLGAAELKQQISGTFGAPLSYCRADCVQINKMDWELKVNLRTANRWEKRDVCEQTEWETRAHIAGRARV